MVHNTNWPLIEEAISFQTGSPATANPPYWVSTLERTEGTFTCTRGKQYELDQYQTGTASTTLNNTDGAYDPNNTSSPFYPLVVPYRAYRRRAQFPATVNIFSASQATAGNVTYDSYGNQSALAAGTLPNNVSGSYSLTTDGAGNYKNTVPSSPVTQTKLAAFSGWTADPGTWYTASCTISSTAAITVQIIWSFILPNGTTVSSGGASSPVAITSTPVRLVGSYMLDHSALGVIVDLIVFSGSAACTVTHNTWQLERNTTNSSYVQPNPWYSQFTGLTLQTPQDWADSGTYGTINMSLVDVYGWLSQATLLSPAYQEILNLNPTFLYCLDEPDTATLFYDATATRSPMPLQYVGGLVPATITAGSDLTSASTAYGIGGPVVAFDNPTDGPSGILNLGATNTTVGPSTSAAWSRIFTFQIPAATLTATQTIWSTSATATDSVGVFEGYGLIVPSNGLIEFISAFPSNGLTTIDGTVSVGDGDWHMVAITMSADGKTVTVYQDGALVGAQTGAVDQRPVTNPGGLEALGATWNGPNVAEFGLIGALGPVAEFPVVLTLAQVSLLWSTFAFGGSGLGTATSASRWADILRWEGYAGPQAADNYSTGETATYGPAVELQAARGSTGTSVVAALQTVVDTENGTQYVAGDGTVTLKSRRSRYNPTTPVVTFGENTAAGEIPYVATPFNFDPTRLGNDASITQTVTGNVIQYQDATSITAYGDFPLTRSVNSTSALEVSDAAHWLVGKFKNPIQRIQKITIPTSSFTSGGAASNAAWAAMLPLEIGDYVQVNRRPPGATEITILGFIESIAFTGDDKTNARFDLQISPANFTAAWEMGSSHTTLHTAVSIGGTSMVINPLPDSATNAIQSNISSAGDVFGWVIDWGTAKAEFITITKPTANSAGYTTATVGIGTCVTLAGLGGTGFQFAHSVNAVIQDIGGFTLEPAWPSNFGQLSASITPAGALDTYSTLGSTAIVSY